MNQKENKKYVDPSNISGYAELLKELLNITQSLTHKLAVFEDHADKQARVEKLYKEHVNLRKSITKRHAIDKYDEIGKYATTAVNRAHDISIGFSHAKLGTFLEDIVLYLTDMDTAIPLLEQDPQYLESAIISKYERSFESLERLVNKVSALTNSVNPNELKMEEYGVTREKQPIYGRSSAQLEYVPVVMEDDVVLGRNINSDDIERDEYYERERHSRYRQDDDNYYQDSCANRGHYQQDSIRQPIRMDTKKSYMSNQQVPRNGPSYTPNSEDYQDNQTGMYDADEFRSPGIGMFAEQSKKDYNEYNLYDADTGALKGTGFRETKQVDKLINENGETLNNTRTVTTTGRLNQAEASAIRGTLSEFGLDDEDTECDEVVISTTNVTRVRGSENKKVNIKTALKNLFK